MLGRMSAAINHEINQPLASLRLNTAALRRLTDRKTRAELDDKQQDDIRHTAIDIDRTTKRITRVIETLRNLTRQGRSDYTATQIANVLRESVDTVRSERPVASASLKFEPPETILPTLMAHPLLLQQAILNLLYNALDAVLAATHPEVTVTAIHADNEIRIQVIDNGNGIDPEVGERLFQAFESSRSKTGGLGLGLTLARQIAEDHGGTLSYQRSHDRSVFTLHLPLEQTASSGSTEASDKLISGITDQHP